MPQVKVPKIEVGKLVDKLYALGEKRRKAVQVVKDLQAEETELSDSLRATYANLKMTSGSGRKARATVGTRPIAIVEDWDKFQTHIRRTKGFDLMQRRVAIGAVQERLEDGKKVPGVVIKDIPKVSVTKLVRG